MPSVLNDDVAGPARVLRWCAWSAVGIHLVAGVVLLVVLRHGLETNPDLRDRATFVATHAAAWRWSWFAWNASAISMLIFVAAFARWGEEALGWSRWAAWSIVGLCVGAVMVDLSAEMILMWIEPGLAQRVVRLPGEERELALFTGTHRIAVLMTGFLANGLYTTVSLVLAIAARRVIARWVTLCGLGVGVGGYALSITALLGSAGGMFWSNVLLMPCILAWMAGVGWCASSKTSLVEVARAR